MRDGGTPLHPPHPRGVCVHRGLQGSPRLKKNHILGNVNNNKNNNYKPPQRNASILPQNAPGARLVCVARCRRCARGVWGACEGPSPPAHIRPRSAGGCDASRVQIQQHQHPQLPRNLWGALTPHRDAPYMQDAWGAGAGAGIPQRSRSEALGTPGVQHTQVVSVQGTRGFAQSCRRAPSSHVQLGNAGTRGEHADGRSAWWGF